MFRFGGFIGIIGGTSDKRMSEGIVRPFFLIIYALRTYFGGSILPFQFFVGSYGQGRSRSTYADDYCSNTGSLSVKQETTKICQNGERNGHIFTFKLTQKQTMLDKSKPWVDNVV